MLLFVFSTKLGVSFTEERFCMFVLEILCISLMSFIEMSFCFFVLPCLIARASYRLGTSKNSLGNRILSDKMSSLLVFISIPRSIYSRFKTAKFISDIYLDTLAISSRDTISVMPESNVSRETFST